jgi:branched-chain amino acid transport system substrate-binding protein
MIDRTPEWEHGLQEGSRRFKSQLSVHFLALLLIPPFLIVACSHLAHAAEKPIKIGLLAPLTARDEQPPGKALLEGATLATEQINRQGGIRGAELKLIPKDDASNPATGAQTLRELAQKEECVAIIGSPQTTVLMASMPIANEEQIPLLAPNKANEITQLGNKWLYRVGSYDQLTAACVTSFAVGELKWRRIAILNQKDELGTEIVKDISRNMRKLGAALVSQATFDPGERDFTVPIGKILKKEPDGMVVWGPPAETACIAQQLRQIGYHGVIIGSPDLRDAAYIEISGQAGDHTVFPAPLTPTNRRPMVSSFYEDFQARFGYPPPSDLAASGYEAIMLLVKAMLTAKFIDRKAIRDGLSNIASYELIQGLYTFKGSHGDGLRSLPILIYLNRQQIPLNDQYHPDPRTLS